MNLINHEEVQFPGLGIKFNVDPVAFRIGNFEVYWYGILIAAALVVCIVLALKQAKKNNFPDTLVYDTMLVTIPCAIIGARAYYVIFNWNIYKDNLKSIFDTRAGGLAVYGGILLCIFGLLIMCKLRKIPFTSLADYVVVYLPLGQAIGRWGNFFNQEAFGTTTTLPWGMWSESTRTYLSRFCPDLVALSPVHPTFLYESVADLIIFIILLQVRKKSTHAFETSCTYFVLYGAVRFFIEGLRTDSLYIAGTQIRASQALSLFLLLFGLFYIAFAHLKGWERKPFPAKLFAEAAPVREASKAETEEDSKKESESEEGSSEAEDAGEEADKDEEAEEKTKDSKDSKAED
ncbi:MAG: prolipoprotein diacylglyceryl transferase [Clostridiales bacterium]|nr:prolipoprotein diacylglyceryl transferase [Clostridiales bacterium]